MISLCSAEGPLDDIIVSAKGFLDGTIAFL